MIGKWFYQRGVTKEQINKLWRIILVNSRQFSGIGGGGYHDLFRNVILYRNVCTFDRICYLWIIDWFICIGYWWNDLFVLDTNEMICIWFVCMNSTSYRGSQHTLL